MDWNDYLTIIFGFIATVLILIQLSEYIPKRIKLVFSEIIVHTTSMFDNTNSTLRVHFLTENISNKKTRFSISAILRIKSQGTTHYKMSKEERSGMSLESKKSTYVQLFFDFPNSLDTWDNPEIRFIYTFLKGNKIITRKTRWLSGMKTD